MFDLLLDSLRDRLFLIIDCSHKFEMANGTRKSLSDLFPNEIQKIRADLSKLKIHGILGSSKLSNFSSCGNAIPNLYLYQHTSHKSFSAVTFTMIAGCCNEVVEEADALNNCGHEHHDYLLPYFYANQRLESHYQEIIEENDDGPRKNLAQTNLTELQTLLGCEDYSTCSKSKFYTSGRPGECANAYNEDTWTTRLFFCLSTGLKDFSGKLTASLRGRRVGSAVIQATCPPGVPEECFLFMGVPDFTISWKKPSTGSPVSVVTTDPTITISDSPNSDESELDTSGRCENAHQMSPNNVYRNGSLIPTKGGELIAAIHQSMLLKILRKLKKQKPIELPLVGNGFYIHKVTGTIHFELKIGDPNHGMEVKATIFENGLVDPKSLCSSIEKFRSKLKKPTRRTVGVGDPQT